jgi:arsenate reductase
MTEVTIYNNPACGTSRRVLAMLRDRGIEPRVVEYLQFPPSREELSGLISRMGVPARSILRLPANAFPDLGLDNPALTDDQLLDAMVAHPILINRPIVVTPMLIEKLAEELLGCGLGGGVGRSPDLLPMPLETYPKGRVALIDGGHGLLPAQVSMPRQTLTDRYFYTQNELVRCDPSPPTHGDGCVEHPADEADNGCLRVDFDRPLKLEFHGSRVTSDVGILA